MAGCEFSALNFIALIISVLTVCIMLEWTGQQSSRAVIIVMIDTGWTKKSVQLGFTPKYKHHFLRILFNKKVSVCLNLLVDFKFSGSP